MPCYDKIMKIGKIIPNGVSLEKHENETVVFFTNLGFNIELIPPSNIPKTKTPDFIMDGKAWEMKSPHGKSHSTIEHSFRHAATQSENIILDLRRNKISTDQAKTVIKKLFNASRRVHNLKVITKEQALLDFKK